MTKKELNENQVEYAKICNVEDLCHAFHYPLIDSDEVQVRLERVLDYLQEQHVIDSYDANAIDWLFGDEQCY